MTELMTQDDDPVTAYKKKYGGTPPASADSTDPVAQYRAKYGSGAPQDTTLNLNAAMQPAKHDYHAEYKSGALADRMESENEAEKPASNTQQALGGVAALGRSIPGVETLQAGTRAMVRTIGNKIGLPIQAESYPEAYQNIRKAEGSTPTLRTPWYLPDVSTAGVNSVIGGTVAAAAMPNRVPMGAKKLPVIGEKIAGKLVSPAQQAGLYGAAEGAAQANPDAGPGQRISDAAKMGVAGLVAGKVLDIGSNRIRTAAAPSLGTQALNNEAATASADATNYGIAKAEAHAAGGTSPAVQQALSAPDIKPYADIIRSSRVHAGADDAEVLREAMKLMNERQGNLSNRIAASDDFKAGSSLERREIGAAKSELLRAAEAPSPTGPPVMPSLRDAAQEHAAMEAQREAGTKGSKAVQVLMKGKQVADKNLTSKSNEAFLRKDVPAMSPDQAEAALNGVFGRSQDYLKLKVNPLKTFNRYAPAKITPFVQQLEQQMGGAPIPVDILRALAASQGHPSP